MEARNQPSRRLFGARMARLFLICMGFSAAGPPSGASEPSAVAFRDPKRYSFAPGATGASGIYAVDVDGDRLPDVLAPCGGSAAYSQLLVLRNLGGRALSVPEAVPLRFHFYRALPPADFDGDGDLDVVVLEAEDSARGPGETRELLLVRNDGRGRFVPAERSLAAPHPYAGTRADFDGDGDIDIAVVQSHWSTPEPPTELALLLNRGDGTFEVPRMVPALPYQWSIASGDLDGDGLPEIVLSHPAAILWNLGGGRFASPRPLEFDDLEGGNSIEIGDVDGDGANDLFFCHPSSEKLAILWNDGRGAFVERTLVPGACQFPAPKLADVSGDGRPDIITCPATVYGNAGERRFQEGVSWAQGWFGYNFDAADLDADRYVDLLFESSEWDSFLSVLYNRGGGSFGSARQYAIPGEYLTAMIPGDFDRDGDVDFVMSSTSGVLALWRNRGDGTFQDGGRYGWPSGSGFLAFLPSGFLSGDFDGDGDLDLIAIGSEDGGIVLWNQGDGAFLAGGWAFGVYDVAPEGSLGWFQADARDYDQDGDLDIALLSEDYLTLVFNDGSGWFRDPVPISVRKVDGRNLYYLSGLVSVDFDGDKDWDLALAARDVLEGSLEEHSAVWVVRNEGARQFAPRRAYVAGGVSRTSYVRIVGLAAGDMDSDGIVDLVAGTEEFVQLSPTYYRSNGAVEVLRGDGRGGFALHSRAVTGGQAGRAVFLGDVDGDGDLDVATTLARSEPLPPCCESMLQVLFNDGKGNVGEILTLNADQNPVIVAIEDLNGDGLKDLAVGCSDAARADIFLNEARAVPPEIVGRFVRGDADGDGTLKLADPVALLTRLFLGGASLPCEKAADADDDGILRLVDAVYILRYLFSSGSPPATPFPHCGLDPTEDALACVPRAYCP